MRVVAVLLLLACGSLAADTCVLPAGTILRVAVAPNSPRSVKPNTVFDGAIRDAVYHGTCRLLPPGVPARATAASGGLRLELTPPGLTPIALQVSLVRFAAERRAVAGAKPERAGRIMLLRTKEDSSPAGATESAAAAGGSIPAGARVRVSLESAVTSKASRKGEFVRARLLEPIFVDGKALVPEGTIVHGTLAGARGARRLYRAGSLRLAFQALQLAPNRVLTVPMSVAAGDLAGGARIDDEGAITGGALTKKRALINLGISYATGKILDDVIEEGAKAVWGMAAAGSAEVAARYVGLGAGAAMFLLHRGREVKLDADTELLLTFSRPVDVSK